MYRLRLLGGASIDGGTGALTGPVAQRRRLALLALLAAGPAGAASRDRVAALLFPEADAEAARHGLSNALHAIRRALGRDAVVAAGDELRLNPAVVASDVTEFASAIAAGERERAAAIYRGPFLDGFFVPDAPELERWIESERQRFARGYACALEELAEAHEARGDRAGAVTWWRRLAACDPYSSRIAVRTMRALEAAGDPAAAIQHARLHESLVRGALDLEPDAEVRALAERMRARQADSARTPPVAAASGPPGAVAAAVLAEPRDHRSSGAETRAGLQPARVAHGPAARWRRPAALLASAAMVLGTLGAGGALAWRRHAANAGASGVPPIRSIAVLPFENLSGDSTQSYLSDGMTEALITELARLRGDLRIISRASAMRYKKSNRSVPEIARELAVDAVVEGSVIREGTRVRVNAQLVHAPSDRHLWAERYDREFRHLLSVQTDIAGAIAREVGHRASPPPPGLRRSSPAAVDPAVHEAYMRGREALVRNSSLGAQLATRYFQQAIAGDSTYAPAWAGLSDALVLSALVPDTPQRDLYSSAKVAAQRAIALDDRLAEAHVALGNVLKHEGDAAGAEAEIRRAIVLDPNHARARQKLGELLVERGAFAEAERHLEVARSLDPLSPVVQSIYGWALASQGKYDTAIAVYRHVLAQDSTHVLAHSLLGASLIFAGRYDEALEAMRRFERMANVRRLQHVGVAYARSGRRAEAWRVYRQLEANRGVKGAYALAVVAANLGDVDLALHWLEVERQKGSVLLGLRYDPWLAPLRDDPRFVAFVRRTEAR